MIDQIKSLMQKHDWFFDYSDDMRDWRKGSAEKQEIRLRYNVLIYFVEVHYEVKYERR